MTCRSDSFGGRTYRFCPDDPPLAADRLRAVVRWSAIDEIQNAGPNIDFTVATEALGLAPRIAQDGLMGLVGNPARLYPGLGADPVDIAFSLAAPGYLTRNLTATLGPIADFPNQFAPVDMGIVYLHRQAVVLRGRIVQHASLASIPVPGVPIRISGVWSTFPPPDAPASAIEDPNLVSLHPGLYADRTAVDSLRSCNVGAVAGQDKVLALPAPRGEATARLSNRIGVVPGTLLAFERDVPGRVEYVLVAAVNGASTDDQPATVKLAHALRLDHEEGTLVEVVLAPTAPSANAFIRDGIPGDRVAFLAGLADVIPGVVEISGGETTEYQTCSLFETVSDADGYYRLPPLSRVASVKLQTPDLTPAQEPVVSPDYGRYENLVDVVYP
jgi:hypothetical protein